MDIKGRFMLWWNILARPAWWWFVVVLFGIISAATWGRDEFLDVETQDDYNLRAILADWTWEWWALIALGLALVISLESAYRHVRSTSIDRDSKVSVTAKLSNLSTNCPDPGPDKVSLRTSVIWEVWSLEDVSVDRLALNIIYDYGRRWWRFWKSGKVPMEGIPPNGESTTYRIRYGASDRHPNVGHADFDYVADRDASAEPHWLLELVLITGLPRATHRIPVFIDWDEIHSRGTNPPL